MDKAREGTPPELKQPSRGAFMSEKLGKALLVTAGSRRESWLRAALGSALPSRGNDLSPTGSSRPAPGPPAPLPAPQSGLHVPPRYSNNVNSQEHSPCPKLPSLSVPFLSSFKLAPTLLIFEF